MSAVRRTQLRLIAAAALAGLTAFAFILSARHLVEVNASIRELHLPTIPGASARATRLRIRLAAAARALDEERARYGAPRATSPSSFAAAVTRRLEQSGLRVSRVLQAGNGEEGDRQRVRYRYSVSGSAVGLMSFFRTAAADDRYWWIELSRLVAEGRELRAELLVGYQSREPRD